MTLSRPAAQNPFLSKEIAAPSNEDWCLPPEPAPLKFDPTLYFHYCWARGFVFLPLLYLLPQSFNLSIQNHGLCLSFKSCRLSFNLALKILKMYLDALIKKVPVCLCTIHVWSVGLAVREKGRFSHTTFYSSFPSQWRLADIFWKLQPVEYLYLVPIGLQQWFQASQNLDMLIVQKQFLLVVKY